MSQQNKMLMQRSIDEVWSRGNYTVVDELIANEFAGHVPPDEIHGPQGVKQYVATLRGVPRHLLYD